jgi:hypothetical protein
VPCTYREKVSEPKHKKVNPAKTRQSGWKVLVISGKPSEAGGPCEGAFHNPALGQQDETVFGLLDLDNDEVDSLVLGSGVGLGSGGSHFGDYWRFGLPMELLVLAIATSMLLLVWPLTGT